MRIKNRRGGRNRFIQELELLILIASYQNPIQMLKGDSLNALPVNERAALAANIDEEKAIAIELYLGMLARHRIVQELQIVLGLTANREDALAQSHLPFRTEAGRNFQLS